MPVVTQVSAQEITRLLAPIDPAVPAGLFDIEDETYQAIDQEMVKLGGLQEASIDWVYIEEASRQYLSLQCKHMRIAAHLSVAWLRSGCWERWGGTLALLAGMVERYWEPAHPKPGPKGFLGKRKLVELVISRLINALPRLDRFTFTPAYAAAAQEALRCLQQQQGAAQLDAAALHELERLLRKQVELANGIDKVAAPAAPATSIKPAPLADVIAAPMPRVSVGNERETRRAVLSMAEFINQQDPYDPAGYQLRRFGLWAHIQAAPQARQGNRTELMAVPMDIAGAYEDAIAGSAIDPALLQRIEKSVAACPFWIRGSFLAATVATRLARWLRLFVPRPLASCSACRHCSSCVSATAWCLSMTHAWPGSKVHGGRVAKVHPPMSSAACARNWSAIWKQAVWSRFCSGCRVSKRTFALPVNAATPR